ncbi:MAG: GNAT family N-acetyltransferase [Dehalococcoidia bacterium]|nr:GNAT family N-acetyltransferase [Dehalococcoidia bacterium]
MKVSGAPEQSNQIELLLPGHVTAMRVPWWSQFDSRCLVHHLAENPGVSFRVMNSGQYLVGGYWRGRSEIGQVLEVIGSKNRLELVQRTVESFRKLDCTLVVLSSGEADREAKWFIKHGWPQIDEIVIYTRGSCRIKVVAGASLRLEQFQPQDLDELLALEAAAFPFLWWSGRVDFLHYVSLPEVRAFVLKVEGRMAGYVSFTKRGRQGFLDRIAVQPDLQGRGYGAKLLLFVLEQLDKAGATTVALNTQVTNRRAQNLYQTYGFVRTDNIERIYGVWLPERGDRNSTRS